MTEQCDPQVGSNTATTVSKKSWAVQMHHSVAVMDVKSARHAIAAGKCGRRFDALLL